MAMRKFLFEKKVHDEDIVELSRLLSDSTPFAVREAYSKLCTNIMYLPSETKCKKLVVTSATAGEGKTLVSVNMSICLAQLVHNAKILLIDSDMRCSRVNRLLIDDETENRGLSEYLAGLDAEPYIRRLSNADNLYVIGAGAKSPNPAGLLASNKMKDLIARLENEYDYIIIDTPPIGIVTDALLYSTYVTGYILSCRADYSNINLVKETITSIREVSGNVLGVILNSLNPKLSKRKGHYGYDSYMGYDTYKNSADN